MAARDIRELDEFINQWCETPNNIRECFLHLIRHLESKEPVAFEFIPRQGLTYSLRASRPNPQSPALFALIDVIEDDPRWLSVCFFAEMISDPEEKGDMVPEGLLGSDAHCFDLDEYDEAEVAYMAARLDEAFAGAAAA